MEQVILLALLIFTLASLVPPTESGETILSTVLTPDTKEKTLSRQLRSYYDYRYGARPLYERLEYARPDERRCGRCYDDRYDDRDDDRDDRSSRDRDRDRYDDDRRTHRPTSGNRYDRNKDDDDDDRRYNTDRKNGNKNGTDDEYDNDKNRTHDDKDSRPSGSRRGDRDRDRNRNRHDDRDRYRPDNYDRFLQRDPYRDRAQYDRPYYEDPYRERRPVYDRYPYQDDGYGGRYDGNPGYRRPLYEDRYSRGGYDDAYGGYGPGAASGPHDSFRPWDETYRGQAGWDAGGRGYYFASGRPDAGAASAWAQPGYTRPQQSASAWQSPGYASGYQDPTQYRGSVGYGQNTGYRQDLSAGYGQNTGYRQDLNAGYGQNTGYRQDSSAGYGQPSASGWHSVGERIRPYRDQSGVNQLDNKETYRQPPRQDSTYGQADRQQSTYGQPNSYGQNTRQVTGSNGYSSTTTQQTSYLYQRDNEQVTTKAADETTKPPS